MAIHTDKNKSNYWYWYNNISMEISEKTTCREGKKKEDYILSEFFFEVNQHPTCFWCCVCFEDRPYFCVKSSNRYRKPILGFSMRYQLAKREVLDYSIINPRRHLIKT
jgi:hypothetical protein